MSLLFAAGSAGSQICATVCATVLPAVGLFWHKERKHSEERQRDHALRAELEAYAKLDTVLAPDENERGLAKRVCRLIAEKSSFPRVALLLEDSEERLAVTASAGFDDVTVEALNEWGFETMREGRRSRRGGERSFVVALRPQESNNINNDTYINPVHCPRVLLFPLETSDGRVIGAIAACSWLNEPLEGPRSALELLAARLGCTIENHRHAAQTHRMETRPEKRTGEERKKLAFA